MRTVRARERGGLGQPPTLFPSLSLHSYRHGHSGAPSSSLCSARPWMTTAVADLSTQKKVSVLWSGVEVEDEMVKW